MKDVQRKLYSNWKICLCDAFFQERVHSVIDGLVYDCIYKHFEFCWNLKRLMGHFRIDIFILRL
jgi:hypothetical protein